MPDTAISPSKTGHERGRVIVWVGVALALVAPVACTPAKAKKVLPSASPSPSASPAPSPTVSKPPPVPSFSVARTVRTIRALVRLGPRHSESATFRRAAAVVETRLRAYGYRIRRQRFEVPRGVVDKIPVPGGTTFNVIATPPGFSPREPHLVVGGHLDSVPDTAGANDNASGVAVTVELARLAARAGTRLPVAFVAFAGEERRYYSGTNRYAWGSRVYLERLEARERAAMRGFLDLDMVGSGYGVLETGSGKIHRWLRAAARRLGIPVGSISTTYLSDHIPFRDVGLPHAWVWAGEHPSLHEPWDRMPVVRRAELRRVGSLAWAALRRARA